MWPLGNHIAVLLALQTKLTCSCLLYYNIRRICPFLSRGLSGAFSVPSHFKFGLLLAPGRSASAWHPISVTNPECSCNLPKFSYITYIVTVPLLASCSCSHQIWTAKSKTDQCSPTLYYLSHSEPLSLWSSTAQLGLASLRVWGKHTSVLFSVLAPQWWNELPPTV